MLEWVPIPSSRGSSHPKNRIHVSCIGRQNFLTTEPCGKPICCVNPAKWGKSSLHIQSGEGKSLDVEFRCTWILCSSWPLPGKQCSEGGHQPRVEPQLLLASAGKDIHVWRQERGHDLVETGDLIFVGSSTDAHSGTEKSTVNFPSTSLFPPFMKL